MREHVDEVSVFYFVVYPDGRKQTTTREALERNAEAWAAEGIRFITLVSTQPAPVFGTIERRP